MCSALLFCPESHKIGPGWKVPRQVQNRGPIEDKTAWICMFYDTRVCVCVCIAECYLLGPQKWWLLLPSVVDDDYDEDNKSYWTPPALFFRLHLSLINLLSMSHPSVLLHWNENSEKMQSIFYSSGAFDPQELNTNTYLSFQTPTKVFTHSSFNPHPNSCINSP